MGLLVDLLAGLLVDLLVDLLADLLVDLLADLLVDLLAGLLAAWWGQEARPRWGNHAPPAARRMGLPLKEARSRAPPRAPSRPARSFREMCPSQTNMAERAPPTSMVSASSLTQTRIASCGPTSGLNLTLRTRRPRGRPRKSLETRRTLASGLDH